MSDYIDFGATGGGSGAITKDEKWVESRHFIKVSDVPKASNKLEPRITDVRNYANSNALANVIAYWNGTNDRNQGVITAYYIDKDSKVTQLDKPNTIDTNVIESYGYYTSDRTLDYREYARFGSPTTVRATLPPAKLEEYGSWCIIDNINDGMVLCNGKTIKRGQMCMFILVGGMWHNVMPDQKHTILPLIQARTLTGNSDISQRYVYSCSPVQGRIIKLNIPLSGEDGGMIVVKNDGLGKVVVRLPPRNPFPELVIDELEPKEVSYLIYVGGTWQRITPLQFQDKTLKVVKYDSSATIGNNEYAMCSGYSYSVDSNAPDGTRWKIMNVRGSNSELEFTINGIAVEGILNMEVLDIVKENGNLHYSIKGKGLRAKSLTDSYDIPDSSRVTLFHAKAEQNIDLEVSLPSPWSCISRYTIANTGDNKEMNVYAKDLIGGASFFIPEDGSLTLESNKNGRWVIVNSHLPVDKRLYSPNPFNYNVATRELFSGLYSNRGTGKYIYRVDDVDPYHVDGYEGVERRAIRFRRGDKRYAISNISLASKSFIFSVWLKIDFSRDGTNSVYFLGNTNSGALNSALHIGWRDNRRLTLAFYGNDADWTVLSQHYADKVIGTHKWVHISMLHNASTKKSKLWVNGTYYGEKSHSRGNYASNLNLVFGARNTAKLAGFASHFRFMVTSGRDNINYNCARFYELEKHYFSGDII